MAAALLWLARCALVVTLIAAPWAIGGADPPLQRWLAAGVAVSGVLAWLGAVFGGMARLARTASGLLVLAAGLLVIGAIQLLPHPHMPVFAHAELTGALEVLVGDDTPATARSLEPAATRLWMSRLAIAISAFLSGAWLFGERRTRNWLWMLLGVNGIAVVAFGLVQRASWNGKLFWTIPLELGGQPFAAFVNRNNAAEYLSLCLAGVLGLWTTSRVSGRQPGPLPPGKPEPGLLAHRVPSMAFGVMILLLFGGVLATLSRAGALSAIIGVVLVGLWVAAGRRSRMLLLPLLGIVVTAGVWISISNQAASLRHRLGTLSSSYSTDGRIQHWTDMVDAVRDFPALGAGFGTYRYANKPYESRRSESWFESADNQYLDMLVEGGVAAAVIPVLMLLVAAWLAGAWRRSGNSGEAFACGYVVVAIGLQSATDCWLGTLANLLTLATLAGSLSNPPRTSGGGRASALDQVEQLMDSRRSFAPAAVIGLCAVIASGLGAYEINSAARSTLFRRALPDDEQPAELTRLELDGLIATGDEFLRRRPDDAELHAALARLWFLQYRLIADARLKAVGPDDLSEAARWKRTGPDSLLGTLARYEQIGDAVSLQQFREDPVVTEHLRPMSGHLRAARRHCPILPRIGSLEAIDQLLHGGEAALPLRREAALSPARIDLLHALAKSGDMVADEPLLTVCLARCIALDPGNVNDYAETARSRLSEPAVIERLLPNTPEPLLDFAEQCRSDAGEQLALTRAADALDRLAPDDPELPYLRGRLLWLQRDVDGAVEQLALAVEQSALDPRRRLLYARVLHAAGQQDAAREQFETAQRLAPDDRKIQTRVRELQALLDPSP